MTDPYPVYRELRARRPGGRAAASTTRSRCTRFDDVWRVLTDRERFSIFEGPVFHRDALLRHHDGRARHRRSSTAAAHVLDARPARAHPGAPGAARSVPARARSRRWSRPCARSRGSGSTRSPSATSFDVRHDYASPVAAQVAALAARVPDRGRRAARRLGERVRRSAIPTCRRSAQAGQAAHAELHEYLVDLVAERRATRGDGPPDLIDDLCAYDGAHGPLDDAEIAVQLSTLFIGGSETLPKTVAGGAYELWRHARPARRARRRSRRWCRTRSRRCCATSCRCSSSGRTLCVDTEVAGVEMRAGQRVVLLLICANRDERGVRRSRALRRAARGWTATSGSATACTCASARTSRGSRARCWCRSCSPAAPDYDVVEERPGPGVLGVPRGLGPDADPGPTGVR